MIRFVFLLLAAVGCLFAQTKVGVINSQLSLLETAEMKKAQADMEAKFKPRQAQLEKLQKELEDLQRQAQNPAQQAQAMQIQANAQRKQRELQRLGEDLQGDVDRERQEILQRSGGRMQDIVKKLAEEKALDVVVDAGNTIYFKAAVDITKEATAAYDKAFPLK